jgi:hypothetical protein
MPKDQVLHVFQWATDHLQTQVRRGDARFKRGIDMPGLPATDSRNESSGNAESELQPWR